MSLCQPVNEPGTEQGTEQGQSSIKIRGQHHLGEKPTETGEQLREAPQGSTSGERHGSGQHAAEFGCTYTRGRVPSLGAVKAVDGHLTRETNGDQTGTKRGERI